MAYKILSSFKGHRYNNSINAEGLTHDQAKDWIIKEHAKLSGLGKKVSEIKDDSFEWELSNSLNVIVYEII